VARRKSSERFVFVAVIEASLFNDVGSEVCVCNEGTEASLFGVRVCLCVSYLYKCYKVPVCLTPSVQEKHTVERRTLRLTTLYDVSTTVTWIEKTQAVPTLWLRRVPGIRWCNLQQFF
jgi:hypothetical protein